MLWCWCCGARSANPGDIAAGYCGRCHWWVGDPELGAAHLDEPCPARLPVMRRRVPLRARAAVFAIAAVPAQLLALTVEHPSARFGALVGLLLGMAGAYTIDSASSPGAGAGTATGTAARPPR